ncbi:MAG: hypothetical protein WCA00_13000 [Candidatus Acidiferrales bacterium]
MEIGKVKMENRGARHLAKHRDAVYFQVSLFHFHFSFFHFRLSAPND